LWHLAIKMATELTIDIRTGWGCTEGTNPLRVCRGGCTDMSRTASTVAQCQPCCSSCKCWSYHWHCCKKPWTNNKSSYNITQHSEPLLYENFVYALYVYISAEYVHWTGWYKNADAPPSYLGYSWFQFQHGD
jgi:hypothetical protein